MTENSDKDGVSSPSWTYGERAVGISFNPSQSPSVARLKSLYAGIIDILNSERLKVFDGTRLTPETVRLLSIAITQAQTAQMWAVKAATWKDD